MTDEEWKLHRDRAIREAFESGRPVLADTDGKMQYADGDKERVPFRIVSRGPTVHVETPAQRMQRANRSAYTWLCVGFACAIVCTLIGIPACVAAVVRGERALLNSVVSGVMAAQLVFCVHQLVQCWRKRKEWS